MTMLIVILHSQTPERFGLQLDMEYPLIYCSSMFCRIATPMFYFISALLFFKGCSFQSLERKISSRMESLLVPYLIWNTIFVFLFYCLSHIDFLSSKMNSIAVLNTPADIIRAILNSHHSDLWFVKNLMIYALMAPVLLVLFKNKKVAVILGIVVFSLVLICVPEYKSLWRWLPIYYAGALFGYFWDDSTLGSYMKLKPSKLQISILLLAFVVIYVYTLWSDSDVLITYASPLLIWTLIDGLFYRQIASFQMKGWMRYTFFIFCSHHFVLNVLQKIIVLKFPPTPAVIYLTFIISPVMVWIVLIMIAEILSKHKFYKYLSGAR